MKMNINGVDYVPLADVKTDVRTSQDYRDLREMTNYLLAEIARMEQEATELHEDMKAEGLTFNSIESEGYLRATRTLVGTVKYIRSVFPEVML